MVGFRLKFISPRLIRSTKFLLILFLGLVIFFTNLYFLKLSKPKEANTATTNWENKEEKEATFQLIVKTTGSTIQRKNLTTATIHPKTLASRITLNSSSTKNQDTFCTNKIRVMPGAIVLFKDIVIRPKLGRARVLEVKLDRPDEEDEFFKFQKGFFTLYCDREMNQVQEKLNEAKRYAALTGWITSLEVVNPSLVSLLRVNQSFQAGQYLAIQRAEYANVYWTVIDLLDIFITTQRMGIEPEKLNIVLMDAHPPTPLDPFWSVLFQRLIKLGVDRVFTESDNVFENLVWRYPRVNCPLLDRSLKSLDHIQPFRSFVLKRFGIPLKSSLRNCSQPHKLNVLVSFRRDYQSHPRNLDGTVDRKIANEKDVLSEMEKNFSSQLNITSAQLDAFPLKHQLELVASADIFFGMHGSAHGYPIFMAPGGAVVEIFNFHSGNWHMEKVATLSGHSHIPWTSTDRNAYNTKTRSTTIPAGIPTMLLKKAIFKICDEKH